LRLAGPRQPSEFVPSQHGSYAGEQFSQAERLRHIVVRAQLQTDDAIDFLEPMAGGDDDGYVGAQANLAQQIQSIVPAKAQIQNDQARLGARQMPAQFVPACRGAGGYVVLLEITRDHAPSGQVVVDDEDVARFVVVVRREGTIHGMSRAA
jgi:hypothetical protein